MTAPVHEITGTVLPRTDMTHSAENISNAGMPISRLGTDAVSPDYQPLTHPTQHPEPTTFQPPVSLADRIRAKGRSQSLPTVTLPVSGVVVSYRRLDLMDLIKAGKAPDVMTQMVERAISESDGTGQVKLDMGAMLGRLVRDHGLAAFLNAEDESNVSFCLLGAVEGRLDGSEPFRLVADAAQIADPAHEVSLDAFDEADVKALAGAISAETQTAMKVAAADLAPFPDASVPVGAPRDGAEQSLPTQQPVGPAAG